MGDGLTVSIVLKSLTRSCEIIALFAPVSNVTSLSKGMPPYKGRGLIRTITNMLVSIFDGPPFGTNLFA